MYNLPHKHNLFEMYFHGWASGRDVMKHGNIFISWKLGEKTATSRMRQSTRLAQEDSDALSHILQRQGLLLWKDAFV